MTAETLKPFITPTSAVTNFPAKPSGVTHSKRKARQIIPIILGVVALVLVTGILTLTIWQTIRVRQLDHDLGTLRGEMESLKLRLGINYLEEIAEFQKEYTDLLINDPSKVDDLEGEADEDDDDDDDDDEDDNDMDDDDDDETESWGTDKFDDEDDEDTGNERTDYDEYIDMVNKAKSEASTTPQTNDEKWGTAASASTSSASNDDNVFDDFTSYNDAKKKKERLRSTRAISDIHNELQSNDLAQIPKNRTQSEAVEHSQDVVDRANNSSSHSRKHRLHTRQHRARVLVRRGESHVSAKSAVLPAASGASRTPAVHFHLNRKSPHHEAHPMIHSHRGDVYMGDASASSGSDWQQYFRVHRGTLIVLQPGLYYIYAQICYNNTYDQNGFIVFHGQNDFLHCLNTVPTNTMKVHTCHTSGLIQLQEHDTIQLRDIHQDRNVVLRDINNRSFFGIMKI